jgi:uncharacterized RDD family membrane protein YckC
MGLETPKDYLTDITDLPNFGYTLAEPLNRLGAAIVEGIIIYFPLYFILGYSTFFVDTDSFDIESLLLQAAISILLGGICYPLWSGNLGHKLFGMKVISATDGTDQKKATVGAVREVMKNLLGTFIIPSIWLLWDKRKQNLYDKITNTIVVVDRKKT